MARLYYAAATHEGKVRANNEDNFWVNGSFRRDVGQNRLRCGGKARPGRFAAAVCDGMGGESFGEVASLLAVECIQPHTYYELPEGAKADVRAANGRICQYITEHGGMRSGSTLAALYIDSGRVVCCNVGDSRAYLLREGKLTQLTKDHNSAQRLIDSGQMTPEEARGSSAKHTLTQYLGIFEEEMLLEPHFSQPVSLRNNDCFLLCSDGLTDMLWDAEIAGILSGRSRPAQQADRLIEEALDSGGKDNITVIVVHVKAL